MEKPREYVLGHSEQAAHRLGIQDAHFGEVSERLLDQLALRPTDRVVELGCGPGSFSRRILGRLGAGGALVAVDRTPGLLGQAKQRLAGIGPARFEAVHADVTGLGPWLDGADVVVGRAVLHHVPMAEFLVGRLRPRLRPGTRVGFIEPDFRSPLGRLSYLESSGLTELAPLRTWAIAINDLYADNRISPAVGATLAMTFENAGYKNVRGEWSECRSDDLMIENMLMFYDEVRDRLAAAGIMTVEQVDEQQRLLGELRGKPLPPAWGTFRVVAEA